MKADYSIATYKNGCLMTYTSSAKTYASREEALAAAHAAAREAFERHEHAADATIYSISCEIQETNEGATCWWREAFDRLRTEFRVHEYNNL